MKREDCENGQIQLSLKARPLLQCTFQNPHLEQRDVLCLHAQTLCDAGVVDVKMHM